MTIVHIVPGSGGGFYCQNCVRDIGLAKALRRVGHDVMFVPMYLPFMETPDEDCIARSPVFYGAIHLYLAQKMPGFRRLPAFMRRWFDAPSLLRWAAGKAGTTQANGLGDLTLSVLQGREGRQRDDLDRMIAWLKTQPSPDIVHFSNALLLGLAPAMRAAFGSRIVCTLQDEDTWLDALTPPWRERCWAAVRDLSRNVDLFVPVSDTYAAKAKTFLHLPEANCETIRIGIDIETLTPSPAPPSVPTLGFLSPLQPHTGLHVLLDAFLKLKRMPELASLRLRVAGGNIAANTPYLRALRQTMAESGQDDAIECLDAHRQPQRGEFLRSLSVLSVPAVQPEAFGLFLIEAMACCVPVVQPRLGAYPEIVAATGGGVIYDNTAPQGLADALYPLLTDRETARRYGQTGRNSVLEKFNVETMADAMLRAYRSLKKKY